MITFTLEVISPTKAHEWMERNTINRQIRSGRVSAYARDMKSESWVLTHQCIAFNANGDLIDGQHRLMAIMESNMSIMMYVARYADVGATAMAMPFDSGAQRSNADILHVSQRDTQVAMAILRIRSGKFTKITTAREVAECLLKHSAAFGAVKSAVQSNTRGRGSAGVRAAMVLLLEKYPEYKHELVDQFRKFILLDLDGMWNVTAALVKAVEAMSVGHHSKQLMLAIRVFWAMSPHRKMCKVIRVKDENEVLAEMREFA